ncbi:Glycosyltransferase [Frankia sp. AiPs1]|uniref:glycosyltransferase family 4 protein n=1 Tax=Frankia sp. AiPa1 TaxID=573492 RepID=UPI00202AD34F|nr:glycosyltransferase [Frankia sp. AiPa1]MCL9757677.1 glycosyltransferase family 4 protein [Frankia sp. AiPa1]
MGPRVLVDATSVPADRGGVGRYVDGLVAALGAAGADMALVCQRSDEERYSRMAPHATVLSGPAAIAHRPARLAWEQTGLPLVAEQVNAAVIHSPHYTMPLRAQQPVCVTIHDVTFFTEPDMHTAVKGTFFRSAMRTAVRRAARIIVPSKATRDELVRVLDAESTTTDVAYHGVDTSTFHPPTEEDRVRVRRRLGLGDSRYVAFLGMLEPRKNVPSLIRGWAEAVHWRDEPPVLVLAGGSGWDDDVDAAVASVPSHLRVIRPGYLRFSDLPGYLGGATLVAYPSHGEGFGLPVLEAMACGAPVLTTPRLSLPEVGGDAVAYTQPDADSIGREMGNLLDDAERRDALGRAGLDRAREFTWAASAEAHLASYARAVAER